MPVPTILSEGPTARTIQLQVPVAGPVAVDDEFDVDGHRVRITAVERPDGSRPKKAPGREIRFLYAVMFDTVTLRYTLNLGEITEALAEEVVPEEIVRVGDTRDVGGKSVLVKTLKSDQNRTIHHGGLPARHIVRVFCDLAGTPLRRRGRLAGKPLGRRA
jgi:uncharacterized Zn finger protein